MNEMGNLWVYEMTQAGILQKVTMVQRYRSLIWNNRFQRPGDCELYIQATEEAMETLTPGRFLKRSNDDMVCKIDKIELEVSEERGDYLIVSGTDAKAILDQRIIWTGDNFYGNLETEIRRMVTENLIDDTLRPSRNVPGLTLGPVAGVVKQIQQQISYKNLGELVRSWASSERFGYSVKMSGTGLTFQLELGQDKTGSVIFSERFRNLAASTFDRDLQDLGNVALIAGSGEGTGRSRNVYGYATGFDRHEVFVDANSISRESTYEELTAKWPYPYGQLEQLIGEPWCYYRVASLRIKVYDGNQKAWLQQNFPSGSFSTDSQGNETFTVSARVATVYVKPGTVPDDDTPITYTDIIYSSWLSAQGAERLEKMGQKVTFEADVIPTAYTYREDYNLGDVVRIRNRFGIQRDARVAEVLEGFDDGGYTIEPKLEYLAQTIETTVPSGSEDYFEPEILPLNATVAEMGDSMSALSDEVDGISTDLGEVQSDVQELQDVGTIVDDAASGSTTVTSGTWQTVRTITLPAGVWILTGYAEWTSSFDQRASVRFNSSSSEVAYMAIRGTAGGNGGQFTAQILRLTASTTITLQVYQYSGSDKTISSNTKMRAVLISGNISRGHINAAQDGTTGELSIW